MLVCKTYTHPSLQGLSPPCNDTGNKFKFNYRSIQSNTKANITSLVPLNADLLCCALVREKTNSARTSF